MTITINAVMPTDKPQQFPAWSAGVASQINENTGAISAQAGQLASLTPASAAPRATGPKFANMTQPRLLTHVGGRSGQIDGEVGPADSITTAAWYVVATLPWAARPAAGSCVAGNVVVPCRVEGANVEVWLTATPPGALRFQATVFKA